ncbi:hypothetical protein U0070_003011 [Myodes glareolus]|uniref:Uncharacterized protein n=1 Tax=Myodes glareolus TaxID=447135 RepID=A0AAW0HSM9_MYOGA
MHAQAETTKQLKVVTCERGALSPHGMATGQGRVLSDAKRGRHSLHSRSCCHEGVEVILLLFLAFLSPLVLVCKKQGVGRGDGLAHQALGARIQFLNDLVVLCDDITLCVGSRQV